MVVDRPTRGTLIRRLALVKLRELRAMGLSYSQIGRRFGAPRGEGVRAESGFEFRLSPERLLVAGSPDQRAFLQALDLLPDGLGFFDLSGRLVAANQRLHQVLGGGSDSDYLREEIRLFVGHLTTVAAARGLTSGSSVDELAVEEVPVGTERFYLRGSFVGMDLFGGGSTVLLLLERLSPVVPSTETLRERFGLTKAETKVVGLLAQGRSNDEVARTLFISPHTASTHTKRILQKLGVKSRSEVVARLWHGIGSS